MKDKKIDVELVKIDNSIKYYKSENCKIMKSFNEFQLDPYRIIKLAEELKNNLLEIDVLEIIKDN